MSNKEEIEQSFLDAGWRLDGGFEGYLLIGEDSSISILARREAWESDDAPVFELWDEERELAYRVREIPSPRQAAVLIQEHGAPVEEQ